MTQETSEVQIARLQEQVKTLVEQQRILTQNVNDLVAAMNKGKGAFGVAMVLAGAGGAAIASLIKWIVGTYV